MTIQDYYAIYTYVAGSKAHMEALISLYAALFIWHWNILLRYVAVVIPFGLTMEVILWIQEKKQNSEKLGSRR